MLSDYHGLGFPENSGDNEEWRRSRRRRLVRRRRRRRRRQRITKTTRLQCCTWVTQQCQQRRTHTAQHNTALYNTATHEIKETQQHNTQQQDTIQHRAPSGKPRTLTDMTHTTYSIGQAQKQVTDNRQQFRKEEQTIRQKQASPKQQIK